VDHSLFYSIIPTRTKIFFFEVLTLKEEHRLRVPENRLLRRIFGLKRDEVTEEWR
jgi:hypothetical protein